MLQVIKRDGTKVPFDKNKIALAIEKAEHSSTGLYEEGLAQRIANEIEEYATKLQKDMTIYAIEDQVYYKLIEYHNPATARAYEGYKAVQAFKRRQNTTDDDVIGLLDRSNVSVLDENSNKDAAIVSTQRDLIAGEVSKDIARRKLIPTDILEAHDSGAIHFHDMDYIIQPMFNCCLINLEDMLTNGTVINGKKIDTPKSFQVACTVTTQIIAQVASGQYGGQSINGIDRILAPFVRKSYEKILNNVIEEQVEIYGMEPNMEKAREIAWKRTRKEVKDGIQTIQYQINTLMTTNGQSPFVTLFMYFKPDYEYAKEAALITEEILRQRIKGVKNEADVYITPAFPKLIYVLDEHNVTPDSPYYYLTELAAQCTAKRMYPDYISAKKMNDDMAVYIANLGKYNEGYLVGAWFTFPIDEEDVKEKIGLNEQYEEYAIHDTDNFPIAIGEYVSIEELNSMYEMIEELPDYIVECLDEFISHYGTLEEVVEHKDDIYYYPDCETMTDVAYYYIDELQALGDIPPSLQNYIDYEAYGRDLDMGGCFIETSRGMCEIPY